MSLQIEHPDPSAVSGALSALGVGVDLRVGPEAALLARIDGPGGTVDLR
jgi:hypothetical protein